MLPSIICVPRISIPCIGAVYVLVKLTFPYLYGRRVQGFRFDIVNFKHHYGKYTVSAYSRFFDVGEEGEGCYV